MLISTLMSVVIVFTVCGNLLTIVSVRLERRLRSVSNMYIASLALADLMVGSVVMTFMLLYSVIFNGVWVFGHAVCHLWTLIDYVCCTASLTNVCVIAYDRYKTVAHPLKAIHRRTKKRALYLVLIAWGIPVAFWTAILSLLRALNDQHSTGVCDVIWKPPLIAFTSVFIMVYLPISVILFLFIAMMKVLHVHMKSMNMRMKRTGSVNRRKPTAGHDSNSERTGGISFNPRFPPRTSAIEMTTTTKSVLASEASTEESCETWSTRSEASGDILIRSHDIRLVSVGTNTTPELINMGHRSVGTNTSPQGGRRGRGRAGRSVPDVAVDIEVLGGGSIDSEGEVDVMPRGAHEDPLSASPSVSVSRSTSVDSSFAPTRPPHLKLRKQSSNLSSDSKLSRDSPNWRRYASVLRAERQNSLEKSRLKRQMRAAKTLGLIMTFLLLCWLPFAVMWPLKAVCPHCVSQRVFDISIWVNYLNSSVNPIIYCLCNPQFRKAFRRFLTRR